MSRRLPDHRLVMVPRTRIQRFARSRVDASKAMPQQTILSPVHHDIRDSFTVLTSSSATRSVASADGGDRQRAHTILLAARTRIGSFIVF
jgi:hypothetical protein